MRRTFGLPRHTSPTDWRLVWGLAWCCAIALGCSSTDEGSGSESEDSGFQGPVFDSGGGEPDSGGGAADSGQDALGDSESPVSDSQAEDGTGEDGGDPDGSGSDANGFDYPCEPGTIEACVTACDTPGVRKCLKDWGACIPLAEKCGNCIDDDCNSVVDDSCANAAECDPPTETCPVAAISVTPAPPWGVGDTLQLSAAPSSAPGSTVAQWQWTVQAPAGSSSTLSPNDTVQAPTYVLDLAGQYVFTLRVWDLQGVESCVAAVKVIDSAPVPPVEPEVGCADGEREGFLNQNDYPQIAACAGAWSKPGITPDSVVPTCNRQGGDDGPQKDGGDCSAPDLCAAGWHVCNGWQELAAKSPTGCGDATPPDAKPKSLFFAIRQPSENNIVCGAPGDGFNDVFGCGNLGVAIPPDKGCGPLDRALASTQPNTCGFNEAEPNLGPWQCQEAAGVGSGASHLNEGLLVTKKGCPNQSCSYDGAPVGSSDKGGVVCCRDL